MNRVKSLIVQDFISFSKLFAIIFRSFSAESKTQLDYFSRVIDNWLFIALGESEVRKRRFR